MHTRVSLPAGDGVTRILFFRERGNLDRTGGKARSSVMSIDTSRPSTSPDAVSRQPENCDVTLARNEPLKLRVFINRSVVEVFVNDRQYAAARVYPDREDSVGVSLRAQGRDAVLTSLDAWQMKRIYK